MTWTRITKSRKSLPPISVPVVVQMPSGGLRIAELDLLVNKQQIWFFLHSAPYYLVDAGQWICRDAKCGDDDPIAWHPLPEPMEVK